nr:uncharacterized protein LOC116835966 isoform X2 [Chelonoidis abingdonii]
MEDEEGYTAFNLRPKQGGSGGPSPARNQDSHQCPGWLQVTLGAGNLVLAAAVLLLVVCVSHLVSEKGKTPTAPDCEGAGSRETPTPPGSDGAGSRETPTPPGSDGARSRDTATPPGSDGAGSRDTATPPGSDGAGSRDPSTAECSARLERFQSQLCPPAQPGPAGGSGCKLCPTDWQLRGDKCYWVSRGRKTWSESRTDCSARGSQLLVIQDPEELLLTSWIPKRRARWHVWSPAACHTLTVGVHKGPDKTFTSVLGRTVCPLPGEGLDLAGRLPAGSDPVSGVRPG